MHSLAKFHNVFHYALDHLLDDEIQLALVSELLSERSAKSGNKFFEACLDSHMFLGSIDIEFHWCEHGIEKIKEHLWNNSSQ